MCRRVWRYEPASSGTGSGSGWVKRSPTRRSQRLAKLSPRQSSSVAIIASPEMRAKLAEQGSDPVGSTPQEFAAFVAAAPRVERIHQGG